MLESWTLRHRFERDHAKAVKGEETVKTGMVKTTALPCGLLGWIQGFLLCFFAAGHQGLYLPPPTTKRSRIFYATVCRSQVSKINRFQSR